MQKAFLHFEANASRISAEIDQLIASKRVNLQSEKVNRRSGYFTHTFISAFKDANTFYRRLQDKTIERIGEVSRVPMLY